jgi:hypothetical protein
MNGWYQTKDARTGVDIVINLDAVVSIFNSHGKAGFVMNTGRDNSHFNSFETTEKYEDVLRKLFGPEEGEDDGRPREDPSGFNGVLPM